MRAVVLVDGEHYPPVTAQAIRTLQSRGFEIVGAVFLGGFEKLSAPLELGVPILSTLEEALSKLHPDVIFDCSDDPVVDFKRRLELAAIVLASGASYEAPGLRMEPHAPIATRVPTISVIGSGKRCGKTAISAHVARTLRNDGMNVVVVAMGRGGPAVPIIVRGDLEAPSAQTLLEIADAGEHAASDVYEDAVVARIPVVGARRAGAGPTGTPIFDNVPQAVELALTLQPDLIILEGSGTAIPPIRADGTILVASEKDEMTSWPIAHRILLADLLLVRMLQEQVDSTKKSFPIHDPALRVLHVSLRPTPMIPVEGRRVFVATTAPGEAEKAMRVQLENEHHALVVGFSSNLADRGRLKEDLSAARDTYDVLLCEVKAAAIDVAAREALNLGKEVVFLDNRPEGLGLEDEIRRIAALATSRFAEHARA
ncbi:MAG: hypothetical protein ACYDCC_09395 [Actinomycetota bacterium]